MWINERLPALRRNEGFGYAIAVGLISLAMLLTVFFPELPPFVTSYPAVLFSAFLGGKLQASLPSSLALCLPGSRFRSPRGGWTIGKA